MKSGLILTLILGFALPLGASEEAELRDGPCVKLLEACKAYVKAGPKKKSVYRDCMQPVLSGEKIDSLNASEADIKACQAKKAELKQKR